MLRLFIFCSLFLPSLVLADNCWWMHGTYSRTGGSNTTAYIPPEHWIGTGPHYLCLTIDVDVTKFPLKQRRTNKQISADLMEKFKFAANNYIKTNSLAKAKYDKKFIEFIALDWISRYPTDGAQQH